LKGLKFGSFSEKQIDTRKTSSKKKEGEASSNEQQQQPIEQ
jgi:hypothetical protein